MSAEVSPAGPVPVRFEMLGPLRVRDGGRQVCLGPRKQQLVLAVLLCHVNYPVPVTALSRALWDDSPPRTARKNIQAYVSGLRSLLGTAGARPRISFGLGGYALNAAPAELDLLSFEELVSESRQCSGRPADLARALARALELWQGPVLDGMRGVPVIDAAVRRLESRHLAVFEDWAEAEVASGGAASVLDRIGPVAARYPFRERLGMVHMAALAQGGRRTEALAVYDELRRGLAREFGITPSAALAACYESLLRDPGPAPARPQAPQASRARPCGALPRDPAAFTGRAASLRLLAEAVSAGGEQLTVVTGPAGCGKTALAVHVAHQLREQFPDGCFFARLRAEDGTPRPPRDVLAQLCAAGPPGSIPATTASWQRWLAGRRALVLLDAASGEGDLRRFLPEVGDCAVIVTSRGRLAGLGPAQRVTVPMLSIEEAVGLLSRVIGAERVSADRPSAERIVRAAGLLPLTVRAVADKLAWLCHVPLCEYAGRIDRPGVLLDELALGHPGIRPRLDSVVADLPGAARGSLLSLGRLPGPAFTLPQAAVLLGLAEAEAVRALETLLEFGVLVSPAAEVEAHCVVYEMSAVLHAYLRGHTGRPACVPAARVAADAVRV